MLPDDDERYAIETCRSSESVLKKWFKINDIQLVHLLVIWYLENLQDARCKSKDMFLYFIFVQKCTCYLTLFQNSFTCHCWHWYLFHIPFSYIFFPPHILCKRTAKSQYMSNHFMSFNLHKRHKLILVFQFGAHFRLHKLLLIATCCSCLLSLPESFRMHRKFQHKSVVSRVAAVFQHLSLRSQLCYEVGSPQHSFLLPRS